MDTIHYFAKQTHYYLFTAIDRYSRFAVAITCRRASSKNATAFAKLVHTVFPGNISQVLTDNGSEFQGDFDAYLQQHIDVLPKFSTHHKVIFPTSMFMEPVI